MDSTSPRESENTTPKKALRPNRRPAESSLAARSAAGMVVLDSGFDVPGEIWCAVLPGIEDRARLYVVDRYSADAANSEAVLGDLHDSTTALYVPDRPVVLVGWDAGAILVRGLPLALPGVRPHLVLIDPLPLALASGDLQMTLAIDDDRSSPAGSIEPWTASTTLILPGYPASDDATVTRRQLQYAEAAHMTNAREVIAGRSRDRLPLERPDVVIDVILGLLA